MGVQRVGDMVEYFNPTDQPDEDNIGEGPYAAMVTRSIEEEDETGTCDLTVFLPFGAPIIVNAVPEQMSAGAVANPQGPRWAPRSPE